MYIPELYVDTGEVPPGAATDWALEIDGSHGLVGTLPHGSQTELAEGVATVEGHWVVEQTGTDVAQEVV